MRSHGVFFFFVSKFIISGLKPVNLSFMYLQNKMRLLQDVLVDFGSRGDQMGIM